jgi:hypothetical protein
MNLKFSLYHFILNTFTFALLFWAPFAFGEADVHKIKYKETADHTTIST